MRLVWILSICSLFFGLGGLAQEEREELLEGRAEVVGDPNVLQRAARDSWKKACEDWKKEVKELNVDNKVLILNCNEPRCSTEKGSTVCRSEANYKIKVKFKN